MMAHQIQLFTEASVLKDSIFPLKNADEIIKLQSATHFQLYWYFPQFISFQRDLSQNKFVTSKKICKSCNYKKIDV